MSEAATPFPHPVLRCVREIEAALDGVADLDPSYLPTDAKREALLGLSVQANRLHGLLLRVMASGVDVAHEEGARSIAAWLAHETRGDPAATRRADRLAARLGSYDALQTAVLDGRVNVDQARVIADALDALPDRIDDGVRRAAEARLIEYAADFDPKGLRVLGRRILDIVAPEVGEDEERKALESEERRARRKMRITTRSLGNGLTRAIVDLPDGVMSLWLTQLQAHASPRRQHLARGQVRTDPDTGERIPYSRLLAQAFCTMIEHADPDRLPKQGGTEASVMVSIDFEALRTGLGVGQLSTGELVSAGEARRMACNAGILPVVLGGRSEVLDLGRTKRFFDARHRKLLRLRDPECRTVGCDIPSHWCEAHHLRPWSKGGATDLADGVLLCPFHHHRAHDKSYDLTVLPTGDVRFHRRR